MSQLDKLFGGFTRIVDNLGNLLPLRSRLKFIGGALDITPSEVVVDLGQGRVDARAYGVSPSQSASYNTGALNEAFAAGIAGGPSIVELPPGTINFDSQIRLDRPRGLTIRGAGKNATRLNWIGAAPGGESAILLYNARECLIEGVTLRGTVNPPTNGWEVRGDNNDPLLAGLPPGGCVWRRCDIYIASDFGVHYTIATGAPQANNDQGRFEHCAIEGQVIANVEIGTAADDANPNAKQFLFLHCTMAESQYGVRVWEGSFTCVEGFQALHSIADFAFQKWCQDGPSLYRVRSESSKRFIITVNDTATHPIGAGIAGALNVFGGSFGSDALHEDGAAIILRHPGPFLIEGFTLGDLEQPVPHIQCDAANFTNAGKPIDPASVAVRDCLFAAASDNDNAADHEPVEFNGANRVYHATDNLYARKTGSLYSFEEREESHGQVSKVADIDALRALAPQLRHEGDQVLVNNASTYAYLPSTGTDVIDDAHTSVRPSAVTHSEDGIWSLLSDRGISVETLMDLRRVDPTRFETALVLSSKVLGDTLGGTYAWFSEATGADDDASIVALSDYIAFVSEFDLTDVSWVKQYATIEDTDTIVDTSDNQVHDIAATLVGAQTGVDLTVEFDIRAVPGSSVNDILMVINSGAEIVNVGSDDGVVNSTSGSVVASTDLTLDGWYRVRITTQFSSGDRTFYLVLKQFGAYVGGTGKVRVRRLFARQDSTADGRWLKVS